MADRWDVFGWVISVCASFGVGTTVGRAIQKKLDDKEQANKQNER